MDKKELWLNLANYHFDHLVPAHLWDTIAEMFGGKNPYTRAFADKLSRKLHWDKKFAMKAIWEYKKFVYLGVISDFSVTPSKTIDQVWHEHLLFTEGYRKFCEEIIKYDFAHKPELVPVSAQTAAFQKQYLSTIELYEKEFGSEPPADIWAKTKFYEDKVKEKKRSKGGPGEASFSVSDGGSDTLISMFSTADSSSFEYGGGEFGGGEFGGGGAGGGWDDGSADSSAGDSGGGSDGGGSDGGGGCSGCSGGCGGCGG